MQDEDLTGTSAVKAGSTAAMATPGAGVRGLAVGDLLDGARRPPAEPTVRELRFAGQLALWSLRQGLPLLHGDEDTRHLIEEAFSVAEVPRALAPLESFLRIVAAGALRPVELRAPMTLALGHDEAVMLRALAACQAGEAVLAQTLLEVLLPPSAARAAGAALGHVGNAFALKGLRLADCNDGRLAALDRVFAQSAGSARVH